MIYLIMGIDDDSKNEMQSLVDLAQDDLAMQQLELMKLTGQVTTLMKLRERTREQDESMKDMTDVRIPIVKQMIALNTDALAAMGPKTNANGGVPKEAAWRMIKFPTALKQYVEGTTVIHEWLRHTENVLKIHQVDPKLWVSAMLSQVEDNSSVLDWVMDNIFGKQLNWIQAKLAFAVRYEVICAEEQNLRKMFSLNNKKSKTAVNFLNEVQQLAEANGLDVNALWLIVWCLMKMQPKVAAYVNFSKGPKQKLTWFELRKLTAEAEYNIKHSNISLVAGNFVDEDEVPFASQIRLEEKKVKQEKSTVPHNKWLETATCHTCGEIGHISTTCPRKLEKRPVIPQLLSVAAKQAEHDEVDAMLREMVNIPRG